MRYAIRNMLAVAGAVIPVILTVPSALAVTSIGSPGTTQHGNIERDIHALLTSNPGSHRVGPNAVQVANGVIVKRAAADWYGCPSGNTCIWTNKDQGGYEWDLYNCGNVNLGNFKMPNGKPWNDQVSSIVNNQTGGAVSRFYDYSSHGDVNDPANWVYLATVTAGHRLQNLTNDTDPSGRSINDRIDIVHVC